MLLALTADRGLLLAALPSCQVASDVDVLYQTRIQKERFQDRWVQCGCFCLSLSCHLPALLPCLLPHLLPSSLACLPTPRRRCLLQA